MDTRHDLHGRLEQSLASRGATVREQPASVPAVWRSQTPSEATYAVSIGVETFSVSRHEHSALKSTFLRATSTPTVAPVHGRPTHNDDERAHDSAAARKTEADPVAPSRPTELPLMLRVFVLRSGFLVSVGNAVPDAMTPTIPIVKGARQMRHDDPYDYLRLETKAGEFKHLFPNETVVYVDAERGVPVEVVARALVALRGACALPESPDASIPETCLFWTPILSAEESDERFENLRTQDKRADLERALEAEGLPARDAKWTTGNHQAR